MQREWRKNLLICWVSFMCALFLLNSCGESGKSVRNIVRNQDFNQGWKFINDSLDNAYKTDFDDKSWRTIDLPHDWSIEDYDVQDSLHIGPFYKNLERGEDVGYLRGGTGWYRKEFTVEEKHKNKEVILHFDGVQTEMKLWVNGQYVGEHVYGYTPFYFNITPYLNSDGKPNQIAIKVVQPGQHSRWFTGSGIYRQVSISYLNPIHTDIWGLFVTTPEVSSEKARVQVDCEIVNNNDENETVKVQSELIAPDGKLIKSKQQEIQISKNNKSKITFDFTVDNPALWGIENPALYTARISILAQNKLIDQVESKFGIRSLEFSAEDGFLLNGKQTLLKGACLHHDNGLLGAMAFPRAEERRVKIMKQNGYNAIRTAHNPPSKAFLEACDKQGMLVIDESFDMWIKPKRPNDYHQYYEKWWKKDTRAMLLRDRNHPSIIMWSIGNEIQERADSAGLIIAEKAIDFIKSIDTTRPVTMALCGFWDNPEKEWDDSAPAFAQLDVGGYNYQPQQYISDHKKHPERIMYGSESVSKQAYRYWQKVVDLPYVIGDFIWTGMDYIGEAGIGHSTYKEPGDSSDSFHMPWPWYISWCGEIDILGNKKAPAYYRDILWKESDLEMLVHEPIPEGKYELVHFWGWPKEYKSWNWQGYEKKELKVSVYSNYPKVKLELNGELIGAKAVPQDSKPKVTFRVPYQKGELKVSGIKAGQVQEIQSLETTGQVEKLILQAERKQIPADRQEICYINVMAVDEDGALVPDAKTPVNFNIAGAGELLSAGSANPKVNGSFKDEKFELFRGKGMIIVRSTGEPGACSIKVESDNIESAKVNLKMR